MNSETLQILDLTDKLINKDEEIAALKAEIERKDAEARRALLDIKSGHVGLAVKSLERALSEEV